MHKTAGDDWWSPLISIATLIAAAFGAYKYWPEIGGFFATDPDRKAWFDNMSQLAPADRFKLISEKGTDCWDMTPADFKIYRVDAALEEAFKDVDNYEYEEESDNTATTNNAKPDAATLEAGQAALEQFENNLKDDSHSYLPDMNETLQGVVNDKAATAPQSAAPASVQTPTADQPAAAAQPLTPEQQMAEQYAFDKELGDQYVVTTNALQSAFADGVLTRDQYVTALTLLDQGSNTWGASGDSNSASKALETAQQFMLDSADLNQYSGDANYNAGLDKARTSLEQENNIVGPMGASALPPTPGVPSIPTTLGKQTPITDESVKQRMLQDNLNARLQALGQAPMQDNIGALASMPTTYFSTVNPEWLSNSKNTETLSPELQAAASRMRNVYSMLQGQRDANGVTDNDVTAHIEALYLDGLRTGLSDPQSLLMAMQELSRVRPEDQQLRKYLQQDYGMSPYMAENYIYNWYNSGAERSKKTPVSNALPTSAPLAAWDDWKDKFVSDPYAFAAHRYIGSNIANGAIDTVSWPIYDVPASTLNIIGSTFDKPNLGNNLFRDYYDWRYYTRGVAEQQQRDMQAAAALQGKNQVLQDLVTGAGNAGYIAPMLASMRYVPAVTGAVGNGVRAVGNGVRAIKLPKALYAPAQRISNTVGRTMNKLWPAVKSQPLVNRFMTKAPNVFNQGAKYVQRPINALKGKMPASFSPFRSAVSKYMPTASWVVTSSAADVLGRNLGRYGDYRDLMADATAEAKSGLNSKVNTEFNAKFGSK